MNSLAEYCHHGETVSLRFNNSLEFKYITPGRWYINFVPERLLTSDNKFISFTVSGTSSVNTCGLTEQSEFFFFDLILVHEC